MSATAVDRCECRVLVTGARAGMAEALAGMIARADGLAARAVGFDELDAAAGEAPTVAVVDVDADPSAVAGAAAALRRWVPGLPLVTVWNGARNGSGPAALDASSTVSTQAEAHELLAAIGAAQRGVAAPRTGPGPTSYDPARGPTSYHPAPGLLDGLTPRERHVLSALIRGGSNASIAAILGLSTHTVRTHLRHILLKLGVDSRLEAAVRARACGLFVVAPPTDPGP